MKKFLTGLLIVLSISLMTSLVACNTNGKPLPYEIDETGCIKRFYGNDTNSVNITIPATYSLDENGKIISGKAYEVKAIGEYSFANNNLIETIYIPDTITNIGAFAFYNCAKLNTINVTKSIATIGKYAFELCPQLKTITKNNQNGLILADNAILSSFIIPQSVEKLENGSFSNWTNLTSINIDNNIDYIGDNAFSNCNNLSNININGSLTYLGENAFSDCEKLTSLSKSNYTGICFATAQSLNKFIVPSTVTSIQKEFFYGWKQLKELYIPKTITSLETIFKDNDNLTKLSCGSNNILSLFYHEPDFKTAIENEKMYRVTLKPSSGSYTYNYYIPNTLTEIHLLDNIESYCFYGMESVKKVYLENPNITDFGYGAFAGCSGLTNVYFTTYSDWRYSMSYYNTSDNGIVSIADMNNSIQLANQLKAHNGYHYYWKKA